jgi:lysophospholipase L1-like esterase
MRLRPTTILTTLLVSTLLVFGFAGCSGGAGSTGSGSQASTNTNPEAVFIGQSLTLNWDLATYFPGKNYVNKGAPSDLTSDMLAHFQRDVVSIKPRVVHIWIGNNDTERAVDPTTTESNTDAMVQQAKQAGIRVVLATIPPEGASRAQYNPGIVTLNAWMRDYAASHGVVLADYYSLLVDANGNLASQYDLGDGQHLSAAGYGKITPAAATAIAQAEQ